MVTTTEASRLFKATRVSALSVTWPSARASCVTSRTAAGEVAIAMAAASAAMRGANPICPSTTKTSTNVRTLSTRLEAASDQSRRSQSMSTRRPSSNNTRPRPTSTKMRASSSSGPMFMAAASGAMAKPMST